MFFYLNLNQPFWPRSPVQNLKEYIISSEARKANLNLNKRILIRQPFMKVVNMLLITGNYNVRVKLHDEANRRFFNIFCPETL